MIPPGLAYLSVSERAIAKARAGRHPSFYFDIDKALTAAQKNDTSFTPAISLVFALQTALKMILGEGIENVIARHTANAGAVRAAVDAMGLERLARTSPSNATTAVVTANGTAGDITKRMEMEHGVKIAGGQGPLKGKIIRLGHLGHYYPDDLRMMITALETVCQDIGLVPSAGAGLKALNDSYGGGE
jgi:aspartate aminotransferase-like enzyme